MALKRRKFLKGFALGAGGIFVPRIMRSQILGLPRFVVPSGANNDPVATDWEARVIANGGTDPSPTIVGAVSQLVTDLKAASLWTQKFIFVDGMVPGPTVGVNPPAASCIAPITPILVGPATDPLLNSAGVNVKTLWPTSGSTEISLTGVKNNIFDVGCTAAALWSSATDIGLLFYSSDAAYSFGDAAFGADDYNNTKRFRCRLNSGANSTLDCGGNDLTVNLQQAGGLYSFNRFATNSLQVHFASSGVSPVTMVNNTTNDTNDPRATAFNFWIMGEDNPAAGCCVWRTNCSFVAATKALTLSEFTSAYNAIQAFRTTIGGGFI